jgi:hypothetical protein
LIFTKTETDLLSTAIAAHLNQALSFSASAKMVHVSPPFSPKTVVIVSLAFPADPAALLPAGFDRSLFRVPRVVDDDEDDDDAHASLDSFHDPPNPTSFVVCPTSVVLFDGVHDPPNSHIIRDQSIIGGFVRWSLNASCI